MAKILSQDEIDALLTTVSTGGGEVQEESFEDDKLRSIIAYDFKHPNRVSKDQIRSKFPNMGFSELASGDLWCKAKVDSEDVMVFFNFVDNKLYGVLVDFQMKINDTTAYINKFKRLEKLIMQNYKNPDSKVREIDSETLHDDGYAISVGEGVYSNRWVTEKSKIFLMLTGDGGQLNLSIAHVSKRLAKQTG